MSLTRRSWRDAIRASALPPAHRAVANALAAYWPPQSTNPVLWASVPQLAADTGYSDRHVKRSMAALHAAGWLVLVERSRQHRAPRYAPAVPVTEDASQGGHDVPSGPVDNPPQGGHGVTSAKKPEGTSTTARGDRVSPDLEDPEVKTPLPPVIHSLTAAALASESERGEEISRGGWPSHIHEPNAVRALTGLVQAGHLPLDATELLEHAYRVGGGDPWSGYQVIKPLLQTTLDGSRNPRAVLLARLRTA